MPTEIDLTSLTTYVRWSVALLGAFVGALWLALVVWTFRDMRARSRDIFAQLLASMVAAILPIAGFIIYLILRPRETLSEVYERSLEAEALLQEIEERPFCPGCNRPTRKDWHVCPNCKQMLDLTWNVCAFCATPAPGRESRAALDGSPT
jgi:hypothetical protein